MDSPIDLLIAALKEARKDIILWARSDYITEDELELAYIDDAIEAATNE